MGEADKTRRAFCCIIPSMARRRREKWSSDKNELWLTSVAVTLPFIFFIVLLGFMSSLVISSENLRLGNSVERAFSDVLVALQQTNEPVPVTMQNRDVKGFGYYTFTGSAIYRWGDAYAVLPFSLFTDDTSISDTMISFDREDSRIECIRYAESITFDLQNIFRRTGDPLAMPDIIYLSFDASEFIDRLSISRFMIACSFIVVVIIYLILMKILRDNRRIRVTMRRQENLVSLGEAARTLTHEIKNPLSAITLQLAILKREVPPELLPDITMIDQEAERLRKLTNRVSEFLRNPIGQPEELDIVEETKKLLPLFHGEVRFVETSTPTAPVMFDREKLRSVLENLMKNAIEACEGMKIDVEVEVSAKGDGFFHVYVKDRGCGVRNEDRKRIFDPFFTTKINGSGIGLSISSQFLKAAGGSLKLYPRDGGGTVAEAVIPYHGTLMG